VCRTDDTCGVAAPRSPRDAARRLNLLTLPTPSPLSATYLPAMRMVATKDEFDQLVAASASQALFVDFTATWCGPCTQP
jgi:thiol-disulfide isomerase/thioredoxin